MVGEMGVKLFLLCRRNLQYVYPMCVCVCLCVWLYVCVCGRTHVYVFFLIFGSPGVIMIATKQLLSCNEAEGHITLLTLLGGRKEINRNNFSDFFRRKLLLQKILCEGITSQNSLC